MTLRQPLFFFFGASLVFVAGCRVGPKYARPASAAMPQWSLAPAKGVTADKPLVDDWWSSFKDPELSSLVERAVKSNYDVRQATDRVNQARANIGQARAQFLPQVNANITAQRERLRVAAAQNASAFAIVPIEINNYQGTFDASWEIDVFGRVRHQVAAARDDLAASREDRRDVLITVLADLARYYADLRGSQLRVQIAQQNIDLETETLQLTSVRATAGLATEFDVSRARAQLETTQAQLPALHSMSETSIHRIAVLLGLGPVALQSELEAVRPLPAMPDRIPAGIPSDLLERRPDIRRSEAQLAAQTQRVGEAKTEYFPRFSLTGSGGRAANQLHDLTLGATNIFSVGPTVSLPIFTAGRIRSNVDLQASRAAEATSHYQANVLTALEETENALTKYADEQERSGRLRRSAADQQTALDLAQVQYLAGLTDFLSVLDALRLLYATQDQLAQSDTSVIVDAVALYKALGGGWSVSP